MRLKARQSVTARTLTLTPGRLWRRLRRVNLSLGKGEGKSPRPRHNFQMLAGERTKVGMGRRHG
jgi:hypothetical protein